MPREGTRLKWILTVLVFATILFVTIRVELHLGVLFDGLAAHARAVSELDHGGSFGHVEAVQGAAGSAFGGAFGGGFQPGVQGSPPLALSGEVRETLKGWLGAWPLDLTASGLWARFNLHYLSQLAYSFAILLPVGVVIAVLAFASAVLLFDLQRRGRLRLVQGLDTVLDALPYILWVIPALTLAYWLWDRPWGMSTPYWAYLGVLFLGFGAFLLPFFIHTNLRRLLMLERRGILDGERVTGASEPVIYLRMLGFEMRRLFVYQVLYTMLFAMLLEFSAFEVVEFEQPRERYTVFTQANILSARADNAALHAGAGRELTHRELLERLAVQAGDAPWARSLAVHPAAAFDPEVRAAASRFAREGLAALEPQERLWVEQALDQRDADQRDLFFDVLDGFYFWTNTALVFGLFAALFIFFDLAAYREEIDG